MTDSSDRQSSDLYDGPPRPSKQNDSGKSTGSEAHRTAESQAVRILQTRSDRESFTRRGSFTQRVFPTQGVLLGLDYGTKRVGVAVSTREQTIASPLENYTRQRKQHDGRHLTRLAEEYQAVGLVVGLPVHMSGEESQKSAEARVFGDWLSEVSGLPVCFWDERFTTATAELYLQQVDFTKKKRKARLDKLAAQIMLQAFLDSDDRNAKPQAVIQDEQA